MATPAASCSVLVTVNGIPSVCSATDCVYTFISTTSFITSQTISSSDPLGGTIEVNVSDPLSQNYAINTLTAKVDGQPCTITTGTFASFNCTLPMNTGISPIIRAGNYSLSLFV